MSTTTVTGSPSPDDNTSIQDARPDNVRVLRPQVSDATDPGKALAPKIYDSEIVTPSESAAVDLRMAAQQVARRAPGQVVRVVRVVATHDRTRRAGKAVARSLFLYVPVGASRVAVRVWEAKTNSRYERMMRAAEAAGDLERVAEWEQRAELARERRHRRRMAMLQAPAVVVKATVISTLSLTVFLFALGIVLAIAEGDIAAVLGPITAAIQAVRFTAWLVSVLAMPVLIAAPCVGVGLLWNIGRKAEIAPKWLAKQNTGSDVGVPITPSIVVTALRDLGIAELRKAIKDMGDAGASLLGPIVIAGRGVEVDVTLPSGVATDEVLARRAKLAENLNRHEHELFMTKPQAARTVRLWIADSGALDEPIGPSPLVIDESMTADMYTGRAPWGEDLRGEAAAISLLQRHLLCTGLSNQGKTAALRALALWLALDRTVEFHIADLKGIGDWHMFDELATTLIEGPTDEHVILATLMLEWGVAEMERRLEAVDPETHKNGVTRDLARSAAGFHPIVLVVDEAQQAFMCPAIGEDKRPYGGSKNTSRYFMAARKLHNQGRAVNVILWQGTQNPTDQNLPKLVREGAHIRASLVVGTEAEARMALGDKAINGGAAPHKLRQGLDKGTLVVAGDGVPLPAGQSSITIRTHFIDGDGATEIADRAKQLRGRRHTSGSTEPAAPARDLLADVDEAMKEETRVRTEVIRQRLAELCPDAYEGMTAKELSDALGIVGVEPYKAHGGVMTVRLTDVRDALTERDENGGE
ncbi:ATP-binding protein [Kutzneria buriramensis]|uniref:S-DNA-T family DNA segregation ATPase FtsK/SpoIIIE n=1 Tax=Kutzneria buriramensis TaxID=1045776 RepID=A0A3E0I9V0_9PSEU|nr:ATP-binding protein [Kutzneria buriramensis]REH55440.1 S-DNA-T family DNA segregation ATPase FtsK/SpoIIIE [Kutzneria buriramensis]